MRTSSSMGSGRLAVGAMVLMLGLLLELVLWLVLLSGLVSGLVVWSELVWLLVEFWTKIAFIGVVIASYVIFLVPVVVLRDSRWRSFQVGSVVGMLLGAAIIAITVPPFLAAFLNGPIVTVPIALSTFFFTFFTEVPFVLILGPPIIAAIYKAFPTLARKSKSEKQ